VLLARIRFFERPDLLSALYCGTVLLLDLRYDRDRRWQWLGLPLLVTLWANTHSGVIYGVALLVAWSAGEWVAWLWQRFGQPAFKLATETRGDPRERELWVRPVGILLSVLAALLTVQFINPNGAKVLYVPISQFGSDFWQSIIKEYQPPSWSGYKLFFLTLAGMGLLQALTWREVQPKLLIASAGMGYLACSSQRSILFFVIVAMPHAAYMLDKLAPLVNAQLRRLQFLLLPATWTALVMLVFVPDKTFVFGSGFYRPYYPLEIYKFLENQVPSQNLFNDMRYGGSMQWWLYPKFKPFIDGRGDAYSVEFWKTEYLPVLGVQPEWEEILTKYDVQGVLLPIPNDRQITRLAGTLHEHSDWSLVAFNDHTLLFLRRSATNEPVIARNEFKLIWPGDWSFAALNNPETRTNAANEARRALELSPECLFALTANARACFTQEQFAQAAVSLHDIISRHDVGENYWRDYGFALFRVGELKEADRVFASMIRKKMLPGFASFMRHHIALQEGRSAEARKLLDEALKLEPANQQFLDALKRLDASAPR
jgi:hypothetical protein